MLSLLLSIAVFVFIFKVCVPFLFAVVMLSGRGRAYNGYISGMMRNIMNQMRNNGYAQFDEDRYRQNHNTGSRQQQYHRQQSSNASHDASMTRSEALSVLGLEGSASQIEIKEAYQKLIKMVHPDKGGSAYLTRKLNEAKKTLIE